MQLFFLLERPAFTAKKRKVVGSFFFVRISRKPLVDRDRLLQEKRGKKATTFMCEDELPQIY